MKGKAGKINFCIKVLMAIYSPFKSEFGRPMILGDEIILVNSPKIWSIGMNYPEFKPVIYSSIQIPMFQILLG